MRKEFYLSLGFWIGVAAISLINIILNAINKNQSVYEFYISGIAAVVLVLSLIIFLTKKKEEKD